MDCFMDYDMDYWIQLCLMGRYTWLRDPQCNNMMSHIINKHMITDYAQIATVYIFALYLDVNIMKTLYFFLIFFCICEPMDCFMDYDMDYWIQLCLMGRYTWLRDPQCNNMMSHIINKHMITDYAQIATVYIFALYLDVNIMKTLYFFFFFFFFFFFVHYSCNVLGKNDHVNITVIIITLYLSISLVF